MTALAAAAIAPAWLGVAVYVLSDARRGLAVGTLLAALGLAGVAAALGDGPEALILAGAGLLAAAAGLLHNQRRGWGMLPPGSTPRIVMAVVVGGLGLWVGASLLAGPGEWQARAAVVIVIAVGGGRLLAASDQRSTLGAAGLVALAVGALAGLAGSGLAGVVAGGTAAIALNLMPSSETVPEEVGG